MRDHCYLGDSVYAARDSFGCVVLTTNRIGRRATNEILLEPEVVEALLDWLERTGTGKRADG